MRRHYIRDHTPGEEYNTRHVRDIKKKGWKKQEKEMQLKEYRIAHSMNEYKHMIYTYIYLHMVDTRYYASRSRKTKTLWVGTDWCGGWSMVVRLNRKEVHRNYHNTRSIRGTCNSRTHDESLSRVQCSILYNMWAHVHVNIYIPRNAYRCTIESNALRHRSRVFEWNRCTTITVNAEKDRRHGNRDSPDYIIIFHCRKKKYPTFTNGWH